MKAPEIRQVIKQVENNDLRQVGAALASTQPRVAKAQEDLRKALHLREVQRTRAVPARTGSKVSPTERKVLIFKSADPLVGGENIRRGERILKARALGDEKALASFKDILSGCYDECGYRVTNSSWVGGEHEARLEIGDPIQSYGSGDKVWHKKHAWSGTNSTHVIKVGRDWKTSVFDRGVGVLDGMLTLEVIPTENPAIVKAIWLEQSRGCSLNTHRGFLVQTVQGWKHSDTEIGAHRLLRATAAPKPKIPLTSLDASGLLKRARLRGNELVDRAMAKMAGHCEAGIRDWIAKRGLTDQNSISTRQLAELAVNSGDRIPEVYGVLLAVRRHKREACLTQ